MIDNAQYVDGRVALLYYQPIPKIINVNGKEYYVDVRHAVPLLLAEEPDVPALLEYLGGCCGGKRKVFTLASEMAVKVWTTGNY